MDGIVVFFPRTRRVFLVNQPRGDVLLPALVVVPFFSTLINCTDVVIAVTIEHFYYRQPVHVCLAVKQIRGVLFKTIKYDELSTILLSVKGR